MITDEIVERAAQAYVDALHDDIRASGWQPQLKRLKAVVEAARDILDSVDEFFLEGGTDGFDGCFIDVAQLRKLRDALNALEGGEQELKELDEAIRHELDHYMTYARQFGENAAWILACDDIVKLRRALDDIAQVLPDWEPGKSVALLAMQRIRDLEAQVKELKAEVNEHRERANEYQTRWEAHQAQDCALRCVRELEEVLGTSNPVEAARKVRMLRAAIEALLDCERARKNETRRTRANVTPDRRLYMKAIELAQEALESGERDV